jgi:hypothetical protein
MKLILSIMLEIQLMVNVYRPTKRTPKNLTQNQILLDVLDNNEGYKLDRFILSFSS